MFTRQIFPVLTPLAVGPGQPFPYISGLSLSLGLLVRDPEAGEERFARVKVPEGLDRFVSIGTRGLLVPLESVLSHFLPRLFPEMEVVQRALFRLTRDGDTEISDDADDLLEAVESDLRRRRFGAVVRMEVSGSISRDMLMRLTERLGIATDQVYAIRGLLDLADVDAALLARPPGSEVRAVGAVHPAPPRRARITTSCSRRSRGATSSSSTRTTRSARASRRSCRRRPRIRRSWP